jgi:hypothetical protein
VIDGQTLHLSGIAVDDAAEVERWFKEEPLRRVREKIETLGPALTDAKRDSLVDAALAESETITMADVLVRGLKAKSGGDPASRRGLIDMLKFAGRMLWYAARQKQPELTLEECLSLVRIDTLDEVKVALDRVCGLYRRDKSQSGEA